MTDHNDAIAYSVDQTFRAFQAPAVGYPQYNLRDKPEHYVGRRRYGEETTTNLESETPVVYLAIEKIRGLGDSVIAASLSFRQAVKAAQDFAGRIEGEIFPERTYLPSAGSVRMRREDGTSTPYRVDPVVLA